MKRIDALLFALFAGYAAYDVLTHNAVWFGTNVFVLVFMGLRRWGAGRWL